MSLDLNPGSFLFVKKLPIIRLKAKQSSSECQLSPEHGWLKAKQDSPQNQV